jgi:chemotaxis family two-component system sensor kinase Cph1
MVFGGAVLSDDGPYSVKRHGVTITNCDSEPVQTPGCVQAHGVLLVLRRDDLVICQASENTEAVLKLSVATLLGRSIAVVLGSAGEAQLQRFLAAEQTERNPLYLSTQSARAEVPALDVTVHTLDGSVLVELEPTGRVEASEPEYFALVKRATTRMQGAISLAELCQAVTSEVRAVTGHDRVMIYKFHPDDHGEVVAESKCEGLPGWLGLHYPADDIPKPAREIFKQVWVRPLPDVAASLAEMVPLAHPDTGKPVVMTHCALRGPSVMYTEYLKNMGVRATLTLALRQGDQLWGLIACHHYAGAHPVSYQVRAACELIAQLASLKLKAAEDREQLLYRLQIESTHNDLIARAAEADDLAALLDGKAALFESLRAGGVALQHKNRWFRCGNTPNEPQLEALAKWLNARPEFDSFTRAVYANDGLSRAYPAGASFAALGSGLLALPLSRAQQTLIIWFRPETLQSIRWGGNPDDKPTVLGAHGPRLTPRTSFELFVKSVHERALPWKSVELEAALRLRVLLMDLSAGRAEDLAERNADLVRSNEELDAFAHVASHDLKEPLRGIHRYAHQLRAAVAEASEEQRRQLDGVVQLTLRMDSLLDSLLHFSQVGRAELQYEWIDFNELLAEATEMVSGRAGDAPSEILAPRSLPTVLCDRFRCREILMNLLSNALKYNDKPLRRIEVGYIAPHENTVPPGCPAAALTQTIFYVRDNGIGIQAHHAAEVFQMFRRLHGPAAYGGGAGAGMSIVKKLVERHHGQIWLDSVFGLNTTVYFTLSDEAEP